MTVLCKHDVLLEIWSNLDLPDLTSCARVCVSWNNLLSQQLVWNRMLEKKVNFLLQNFYKFLQNFYKFLQNFYKFFFFLFTIFFKYSNRPCSVIGSQAVTWYTNATLKILLTKMRGSYCNIKEQLEKVSLGN